MLQLKIKTQKGKGTVLIKLLPDVAPKHIERIKTLTNEGKYDNATFHRVIPGFMAQTGDVAYGRKGQYDDQKVGTGGSSYRDLYAELSEIPFKTGVVGMARQRYIHSANSQFFIMTSYHPNLNSRYTVVGVVVEGMDYIKQLKPGSQDKDQGKVTNPDHIISAKIISKP
jgi:peptidyl-prolyl cis-trans isomerase B (cyclophilin B)